MEPLHKHHGRAERDPDAGSPTARRASVIVVAHNSVRCTVECVHSLIEAGWDDRDELIIVDNGSTDGTQAFLRSIEGDVVAIRNEVTVARAGAYNQGAAVASGRYLVFLANDTFVSPGWLDALVETSQRRVAGVVGCRLLYPGGRIRSAGFAIEPTRVPRELWKGAAGDAAGPHESYDCQVVSTHCMLVDRRLFRRVGQFDNAFQGGCHDFDLCLKARNLGARVRYCAEASVTQFSASALEPATCTAGDIDLFVHRWAGLLRADRVEGERIVVLADPGLLWNVVATPTTASGGVCITGMHRSGTSMVTRLLNLCGLSLGHEGGLLPPTDDNPKGYWESRLLVGVNECILSEFGGGWDLLPQLPDNWVDDPRIKQLHVHAPRILAEFSQDGGLWGWKDPRNSVTLPFWRRHEATLTTVVCLRNPLEVAESLHKRGYSSRNFAWQLWLGYNRAVLANTTPGERVVCHYESFFVNAPAELRRLCTRLGLPASDGQVTAACQTTELGLRHSRATLADLLAAKAPDDVVEVYLLLCAEAGKIYAPVLARELVATGRQPGAATMIAGEVAA